MDQENKDGMKSVTKNWKAEEQDISSPIFFAPDLDKPFRGHIQTSQNVVGGMLTLLDENGRYREIPYLSK